MAAMVLVNAPAVGTPSVYPAVAHASWNGWTFADTIFPTFIFVVGVSMALGRRPASATTWNWVRLVRRTALLFVLGLVVNAAPGLIAGQPFLTAVTHLRIMGVLQRIALAGLLTALASRAARPPALAALSAALLAAYGLILVLLPVPGVGAGHLTPWANPGAWVDRTVLGSAHMYHSGRFGYDPEGLLGTLPATATCLLGYCAGTVLRRRTPRDVALLGLGGMALTAIGLGVGTVMPINKRLWTPSYALLMAGLSLLMLVITKLVCDRTVGRAATWPLRVLGANAIIFYLASELVADVLQRYPAAHIGRYPVPAAQLLWAHTLNPAFGADGGSLAYGLILLTAIWVPLAVMYRRKWFIRL